ncbi:nuclear transport factor 2 family protein [Tamlana agarivorans]|uniref:Nuclear transport factor 2 family protein n=1 Tax=Pseudotamlana agarivorans TaxID=481183 RepID=A0ACC5U9N5_9FLAO|nr:nuclear transport factor 2 family protein [Tamlana agarivorans]MBU2950959.1 nuclear transport factor 2 family protein [Tamlana agarivorans]
MKNLLLFPVVFFSLLVCMSCENKNESDMKLLIATMDAYETAWAQGDFLTVERFFTEDAKRLHTEPEVWDRAEIKRYFEEKAKTQKKTPKLKNKKDWKLGRDYIEIRIEGQIAYDIFTTDTFKAIHIWEKQNDGTWKIKYDMGILNVDEE